MCAPSFIAVRFCQVMYQVAKQWNTYSVTLTDSSSSAQTPKQQLSLLPPLDYPAHKQIKESVSLWRDSLPPLWVEHSVMCFCICAEWGSSFFQKTRLLQCKVQHLTFSGFVTSSNPVATLILQCTPEKCEADLLCVSSSAALTCSLSFPRSPW